MIGRHIAILALLVAGPMASCGAGHSEAADSITAAVRQMPGVASAASDYESGWRGDSRFALTAVLADIATPEQAAAVGQTFTELVDADRLRDSDVSLTLDYPATILKSTAGFSFGGRPAPQAVSDALREWLDIARSPGVAAVHLADRLQITVGPVATDDDLLALTRRHPDLTSATWVLVGLVDPGDTATATDLRETYEVTGMVPDAALRDRWNQIVAELGEVGHVAARTDRAASPPTSVTVNIPTTSGDSEVTMAQAWMTFPLLEGLPLPARVEFGGDVFTVGGCSPTDPDHHPSQREAELRAKFERC